jgi:dihydrofolate synthase/folylpolyglutamate synthase
MNYEESIRALLSLGRELAAPRQPALSLAQGAKVQKFGLENITTLAAALGDPQLKIPCAHIAGTNGKGSTAAMLESILRASGLRTGLFTSPHLERINERIRINGENISDEAFAAAWTRIRATIESLMAAGKLAAHPSFFECVTAIAFVSFANAGVDFVVYEVGMGGRFDATNIVQPAVAAITAIDFDHEAYLGHSIEEIAAEKAGIIKPGGCVVNAAGRPEACAVIARRCKEVGARLVEIEEIWNIGDVTASGGCYSAVIAPKDAPDRKIVIAPQLHGRFQLRNALTSATAASLLGERGFAVTNEAIASGIASVRWPGRLERISSRPDIYLDGAHNPAGARELLKFWEENFAGRRILLVYGAMRDKAVDEIAGLLFPRADSVILTEPRQPRAVSAAVLAEMTGHLAEDSDKLVTVRDPGEAFEHAIRVAQPEDAIFVTGSLYLVGDLRRYWNDRVATLAEPERRLDPTKRRPI